MNTLDDFQLQRTPGGHHIQKPKSTTQVDYTTASYDSEWTGVPEQQNN
jgi:hypothetical protein